MPLAAQGFSSDKIILMLLEAGERAPTAPGSPQVTLGRADARTRVGPGRAVFGRPGCRRLWATRTASQWGDIYATVALPLAGARPDRFGARAR